MFFCRQNEELKRKLKEAEAKYKQAAESGNFTAVEKKKTCIIF